MKHLKFLFLSSCILFAACGGGGSDSIDDPEPPTPTPEPEPTVKVVTFTPSLSAPTRATDTQFETGDRIGVFAVKASENGNRSIIGSYGNNYANNVPYTYNGSRFVPASAGIEVEQGTKLYYTAVYPYATNLAATFDFTVKTDQSVSGAYTASDLCTASSEATEATDVNLKFSHRLSKLVINLTGAGWTSSNLSVRINNVLTQASVELNNLTINAFGSTNDVVCASNGSKSYKVILPPQTIAQSEKLLTITMDGVDYSLETQSAQEYRSGKQYEYTINMDANHDIVEFTGDINPWNVDDRIYDVVPADILPYIEPYIPIYRGNNPPLIEGTFLVDPYAAVYCQDGVYSPGTRVTSKYIRFSNQNTVYNTLDIDEMTVTSSSNGTGKGAFISGSGNNFTAYFNTVGQTEGISEKRAIVISGTKTSSGISNLKYAFVMVDKGNDPDHKLMDVGVFRVFKDEDGLSEYTTWPASSRSSISTKSALPSESFSAKANK